MAKKIPAWICPDVSEQELVAICKDALEETGVTKAWKRRSRGNVVVSGIYGSFGKAMLVRLIPFIGRYLSAGNRYKAVMKVGSFKGRTRLRLDVYPIQELDDSRETFMVTQDLEEALADSGSSSKIMRELIQAINQRAGTMEVLDIRESSRKG